jgi:HEAT repeat protein
MLKRATPEPSTEIQTMTSNEIKTATLVAGAASLIASTSQGAQAAGSLDDAVAKTFGAPAVKPLAAVMTGDDFETARSAKRALWRIVRHAGRPGAATEAKAVTGQLIPLLTASPAPVKREVLWMLSEIAGDEAVPPMAALLSDSEVRDDARCALTRMPGSKATAALSTALRSAPEDFKYALADSLRARGGKIAGYPSRKLVPTKQTSVKAGG